MKILKSLILFGCLLFVAGSCKNDEPAPPALSILSIKSGTTDLYPVNNAAKVSISLPIIATFSTKLDAGTATTSNISLDQGTTTISLRISATESTITITPVAKLDFGANYILKISNSIKSDKGVPLTSQISTSFTTDEPIKVFFYRVVASPTDLESITLKNNSGSDVDISNWTIGDTNNPIAYKIPTGTVVKQGETRFYPRSTLGFAINDTGEILYLRNPAGTEIDTWTN